MSTVPDNIPSFLIKDCCSSSKNKISPSTFKGVKVSPLFKTGDKADISKIIDQLSNFSKFFEAILYSRI